MFMFSQLRERLLHHLRGRILGGETTERRLARIAGVSQPHLHNVLKKRRALSIEMADQILSNLKIDIIDLIEPEDFGEWQNRVARRKAGSGGHLEQYPG